MLFISNFIKIFTNNKIEVLINKLLKEYKKKETNMIYIIETYNEKSLYLTNDINLINSGRKKLICEINKIKDKEYGIYQILLIELVKNLSENIENKTNEKDILNFYEEESIKITNNINLIEKYKNILIIKLNEDY